MFKTRVRSAVFWIGLLGALVAIDGVWPANAEPGADVFDLTIEELMNAEVYSASKRTEQVRQTATAIYVISQEDIQNSAATSIPELLRMVPGVEVARFNSGAWSVSIRGSSGRFANKLLVLVDGRGVYSPTFSGTYWSEVDTLLEDIERIEVIRGPGGTLWGANAVNGVINIITKHAATTIGSYAEAVVGTQDDSIVAARYGQALGSSGAGRVYLKYSNSGHAKRVDGGDAFDRLEVQRGGIVSDFQISKDTTLRLEGGLYVGEEHSDFAYPSAAPPFLEAVEDSIEMAGGHVNSILNWDIGPEQRVSVQSAYQRSRRDELVSDQRVDQVDTDLRYQFQPFTVHQVTLGAGYRFISDEFDGGQGLQISPSHRSLSVTNVYFHDRVTIVPDRLALILGAKIEHNTYTHEEVQPSVRSIWSLNQNHHLWAAFSRAVRTPSRVDRDLSADFLSLPASDGESTVIARVLGNSGIEAENLNAYELGYRGVVGGALDVDIATFYFDYSDLVTIEPEATFVSTEEELPVIISPFRFDNRGKGESIGAEIAVGFDLTHRWRIYGTYSYVNLDFDREAGSNDPFFGRIEGLTPEHQWTIRSYLGLLDDVEGAAFLRYVDRLPSANVDAYEELDLRLAWQVNSKWSVSLNGQNLLHDRHQEFEEGFLSPVGTELPRSVYAAITYRN
ncbi:MAG: TonB-dependent receptor [Bdellovibrionales bacterium]|nr:TonB-dependent receptor [Bdellovibrionales bacterium]